MRAATERVDRLYRQLGAGVYQRIYRRLRDRDVALDLTQEIFKNLMNVADTLEESERAHRYLFRCTTNAIHRYLLQQRSRRTMHDLLSQTVSSPAEARSSWMSQGIAQIELGTLSKHISEDDWELLYYRFFEEYSTKEIGEIFHISDRAVRKRLTSLEHRLRSLIRSLESI